MLGTQDRAARERDGRGQHPSSLADSWLLFVNSIKFVSWLLHLRQPGEELTPTAQLLCVTNVPVETH